MLGLTLLTLTLASAPPSTTAPPNQSEPRSDPQSATQPQPPPPSAAEPGVDADNSPSDDGVQLIWDAPSGCAQQDDMQARLDARMGVRDPAERSRWIIARVRAESDGRWSLRIWNAQNEELSERALVEQSCEKLEEATLTIVAITMAAPPPANPEPAPSPEDLEPPPPPLEPLNEDELAALVADAPENPAPPRDDGRPDMEAPERPPLEGAVGFSGGIGTGGLPRRSGGAMVHAALVWPKGRVELRGNYWTSQADGVSFQPDVRGRFTLLSVALRGCGTLAINDRLEVPLCGGLEGGSLLVQMEDLELLHGPGQPWLSVLTGSGLNIRVHKNVAIQLLAEAWIGLIRAEHEALQGQVSRSGFASLRAAAGLEFRFGRRSRAEGTQR